jgi:hypothetical protein
MKLTRPLVPPLACLALFILFAVATPAQNQASRIPTKSHPLATTDESQKNTSVNGKTQQEAAQNISTSPDVTTTCAHTFTSGSGATFLKFCVTANGNIAQFQSPQGVESIREGLIGEGYGFCDGSTLNTYYDWADGGDSGNWNPPILLTHTATLVKIERTTSDRLWTLTQTISQVAGASPYAKVEMQLKNNSGVSKEALLMRWADVDADNGFNSDGDNLDGTLNSAWGYIPITDLDNALGLLLQNVGASPFFHEGFALNTFNPPDPCDAGANFTGTLTNTDGSIVMFYNLGLMTKNQTATITAKYSAF